MSLKATVGMWWWSMLGVDPLMGRESTDIRGWSTSRRTARLISGNVDRKSWHRVAGEEKADGNGKPGHLWSTTSWDQWWRGLIIMQSMIHMCPSCLHGCRERVPIERP